MNDFWGNWLDAVRFTYEAQTVISARLMMMGSATPDAVVEETARMVTEKFVAFAKACGADAYRCERPEEVVPAIKGAQESPGTALVEAIVDPNERPTKPDS